MIFSDSRDESTFLFFFLIREGEGEEDKMTLPSPDKIPHSLSLFFFFSLLVCIWASLVGPFLSYPLFISAYAFAFS